MAGMGMGRAVVGGKGVVRGMVGSVYLDWKVVTSGLRERGEVNGMDDDCDDPFAGFEFVGYHIQQRTSSCLSSPDLICPAYRL